MPGGYPGVGFGQQGLDCFEGFRTWVEHTQPRLPRVHGVWHQPVQGCEVIALRMILTGRVTNEGTEGVSAHAAVEPKHTRAIQLRGIVKVAVVFDDDRGEWKLARWIEVVLGVIVEEGVTCTRAVGWPESL